MGIFRDSVRSIVHTEFPAWNHASNLALNREILLERSFSKALRLLFGKGWNVWLNILEYFLQLVDFRLLTEWIFSAFCQNSSCVTLSQFVVYRTCGCFDCLVVGCIVVLDPARSFFFALRRPIKTRPHGSFRITGDVILPQFGQRLLTTKTRIWTRILQQGFRDKHIFHIVLLLF